jgi:hypothetical protein
VKTSYISLHINSENKAKEDIEACIDLNIYETEASEKLSLSFKIDNSSKELVLFGQDGSLIDSCKYTAKLLEGTIVRFHKNQYKQQAYVSFNQQLVGKVFKHVHFELAVGQLYCVLDQGGTISL